MTIDEYILSHSDEEGALLSALNRDANVNLLRPRMLSGHLQGRILKMFCRMLRPRRVLEIGTYTGYATLCMAEGLEEGQTTVGTALNIEHISATPVGLEVRAEAEVTAVAGKVITFAIHAFDEAGEIGHGTHQRVVVSNQKFLDKAYSKL